MIFLYISKNNIPARKKFKEYIEENDITIVRHRVEKDEETNYMLNVYDVYTLEYSQEKHDAITEYFNSSDCFFVDYMPNLNLKAYYSSEILSFCIYSYIYDYNSNYELYKECFEITPENAEEWFEFYHNPDNSEIIIKIENTIKDILDFLNKCNKTDYNIKIKRILKRGYFKYNEMTLFKSLVLSITYMKEEKNQLLLKHELCKLNIIEIIKTQKIKDIIRMQLKVTGNIIVSIDVSMDIYEKIIKNQNKPIEIKIEYSRPYRDKVFNYGIFKRICQA